MNEYGNEETGNQVGTLQEACLAPLYASPRFQRLRELILQSCSPADFLIMINTTADCRHFLLEDRTSRLFPLVLPLLVPYLTSKDLVDWRLVSKDAKQAIDKILTDFQTPDGNSGSQ
ncbi:unnamed protein product [Orchesella dallaii]|uniref:Uncharacterized protein n=1 Tax=Orchesella dallaii TaxID=48710 RepID=A0ABP1Q156_9HEXA